MATVALVGLATSALQGSVQEGLGGTLAGLLIPVERGPLAPPLDGLETPVNIGSLFGYVGRLLDGNEITPAVGTLGFTKSISLPLVGELISVDEGTLTLPPIITPPVNVIGDNILISYMDYTLLTGAAVTSPDVWVATLPLDNTISVDMGQPSRIIGTTANIAIDLTGANSTNVLAIPKHNLSDSATWRVRASNNALLLTDAEAVPPQDILIDSISSASNLTSSVSFMDILSPPASIQVAADIGFTVGKSIKIFNSSGNYLLGTVDSYAAGTLAFTKTGGTTDPYTAGTWSISLTSDLTRIWPVSTIFNNNAAVIPPALFIAEKTIAAQYYHILLEDNDNVDGYLDLYKIVVSPAWQPSINLSKKWQLQYVDKGKGTRSRGGQLYIDAVPQYRKLKISLSGFTKTEMLSNKLELDRLVGTTSPVLICLDPLDNNSLGDKSIYGTQPKMTKVQEYANNTTKTTFLVEEWI